MPETCLKIEACLKCVWSVLKAWLKHAWSLLEACLKRAWSMLEAWLKRAWSVLIACLKCAWGVLEACLKCAWSVLEACLKRAWSVLEACLKRKFSWNVGPSTELYFTNLGQNFPSTSILCWVSMRAPTKWLNPALNNQNKMGRVFLIHPAHKSGTL